MAKALYHFNLKSAEQLGASGLNMVKVGLASDADAATFKTNLEILFSADVVTVNKETMSDRDLPYPEGSNAMVRVDLIDADNRHDNIRIYDWDTTKSATAFGAALIAAGIRLPTYDTPAVVANVSPFTPNASMF